METTQRFTNIKMLPGQKKSNQMWDCSSIIVYTVILKGCVMEAKARSISLTIRRVYINEQFCLKLPNAFASKKR